MNIKLTIAYDGAGFWGWQKTPDGPSIEESLSQALWQVLQEKPFLQAASRTDKGVHAEGQVVNFITSKSSLCLPTLCYQLNALLPKAIRVLNAASMPMAFHPTLDAKKKEYHYFICNTRLQLPKHLSTSWHVPQPLDLSPMEKAANLLQGTHDFAAFRNVRGVPKSVNTIRTLNNIKLIPLSEGRLKLSFQGNAFLYRMVRNLVGTLVEVGRRKKNLEDILALLHDKKRKAAGVCAPPHSLFLMHVFY